MNMKIMIGILILFLFIGVAVMFAVPPAPEPAPEEPAPAPEPAVDPTPRTGDPPFPIPEGAEGATDGVSFIIRRGDGLIDGRSFYKYDGYYTEADIARLKAEARETLGPGQIEIIHH